MTANSSSSSGAAKASSGMTAGSNRQASDESQGFGLRAVAGEAASYAHSTEITPEALARAAKHCALRQRRHSGIAEAGPERTNRQLYTAADPSQTRSFASKVDLLATMDAYARALDPRVAQVSLSLACDWQDVEILRGDGALYRDTRPLVRLNAAVVARNGAVSGQGSHGLRRARQSGRLSHRTSLASRRSTKRCAKAWSRSRRKPHRPAKWMWCWVRAGPASCCMKRSVTGLKAISTARRRRAFAGLMGQQVAAKGVTVVDDGTVAGPPRLDQHR